jgi:aspartyl/asparaginyl-tRNA synthetase
MIHFAVWDSERFSLKDSQPLHMVKLIGAVRNFRVYTKYVQINVEDGTGFVWVILWRKEKECMVQHWMIDECNSHHCICVIGEVKDYYGMHK